ncbi:MAG: hypothetical protein NVS2B3_07450 [Vulcanimicrobiaceae bacterium]
MNAPSLVACAVVAVALQNATTVRAASCASPLGNRIVLQSDAVDPDVFLWDSRTRLVNYAAGQWGDTRSIFRHTLLAGPGTRATVVSCVAGVAHPQFGAGDEDAIGVKIVSGPYRGRFGWVLSSDVHVRSSGVPQRSVVNNPKEVKR